MGEFEVGQEIYSLDEDLDTVVATIVMVSKYFIRIQDDCNKRVEEIDIEQINLEDGDLYSWYTDVDLMQEHKTSIIDDKIEFYDDQITELEFEIMDLRDKISKLEDSKEELY